MTQLGAMQIKANLPRACALDPQHADTVCVQMCVFLCVCVCVCVHACVRVYACDSEGYGSVPVLIMPQANPGRQ